MYLPTYNQHTYTSMCKDNLDTRRIINRHSLSSSPSVLLFIGKTRSRTKQCDELWSAGWPGWGR